VLTLLVSWIVKALLIAWEWESARGCAKLHKLRDWGKMEICGVCETHRKNAKYTQSSGWKRSIWTCPLNHYVFGMPQIRNTYKIVVQVWDRRSWERYTDLYLGNVEDRG
jgi:hypothetical protein